MSDNFNHQRDFFGLLTAILAAFIIGLGLIFNPPLLTALFSEDGIIEHKKYYFYVWSFSFLLILFGLAILWHRDRVKKFLSESAKRKFIQNLLLIFLALSFCLIGLELILRTGWFDDLDNPAPVWIPARYQEADKEINVINSIIAKNNSYLFNDRQREIAKPAGYFRVAVLGDSFIWGDGVPYEIIWSHKLENELLRGYNKTEIISWGRDGWSTQDEFNFLKQEGIKFKPDLVLVGFVTNDPDLGDYRQKFLSWQNTAIMMPVKFFLPNALDFIGSYFNTFIENKFLSDYGYSKWEDKLYLPENLAKYQNLLLEFSRFCQDNKIKLVFVLTPNIPHPSYREKYDLVIPLLTAAEIDYLDLYPAVVEDLEQYSYRQLWANPADGHPGALVTGVYAKEVLNYLEEYNLLPFMNKK